VGHNELGEGKLLYMHLLWTIL